MRGPRIASLLPSTTEICCALGLEDQIVGISHECDFPPTIVGKPVLTEAKIDAAGSSKAIDDQAHRLVAEGLSLYRVLEDRLAEARPDLILTQDTCEVCAVSFADVEQATRRVLGTDATVISLAPTRLDDVFGDIMRVAQATDTLPRAQAVLRGLRDRMDRLHAITRDLPARRVLHLEWLDPPMVAGHWTPTLLELAGGEPICAHPGRPTVPAPWETLAAADPEVVLIAPCGFPVGRTRDELEQHVPAPLAALGAARDGQAWIVDGHAYFNRPGPRLIDSAEIAAAIFWPEHFDDVHGPEAVQRAPVGDVVSRPISPC